MTFGAIVAGLMSMFLVGRHTRVEEEVGRDELVRAGVVGRYAPMTAALIVASRPERSSDDAPTGCHVSVSSSLKTNSANFGFEIPQSRHDCETYLWLRTTSGSGH